MGILDKIVKIKYYVIRIDLSNPETLSSKCCVFLKKGDKVDLDYTLEEEALGSVIAEIPRHANVLALLTGDQVLSRFSNEIRGTLFEEIEEDEFYLQKTISDGGWMIHSACRKSAIDPILQEIINEKRFLLDVIISPIALSVIENLLPDISFCSDHFRFNFQDGQLMSIVEEAMEPGEKEGLKEVEIGGQKLQLNDISHLAALVHHFQEGPAHLSLLKHESTQSKFYRRFRFASILSLGGLFLILLLNFLFYSHINAKISELQSSGKSNLALVQKIEAIKVEIGEYQDLKIRGSNCPEETYAFYLEEIAGSRPAGIWFNSLLIHPASKEKDRGKALLLDQSVLRLKGEARDPVSLNRFIGALESKDWINDIEIVNYENSPEKTHASFELNILKR